MTDLVADAKDMAAQLRFNVANGSAGPTALELAELLDALVLELRVEQRLGEKQQVGLAELCSQLAEQQALAGGCGSGGKVPSPPASGDLDAMRWNGEGGAGR